MEYKSIKVNGNEYKCRYTTSTIETTQAMLGDTIFKTILGMDSNSSKLWQNIKILIWGSMLQFHKDISLGDVKQLCDDMINEGYNIYDFTTLLSEILIISGMLDKSLVEKTLNKGLS